MRVPSSGKVRSVSLYVNGTIQCYVQKPFADKGDFPCDSIEVEATENGMIRFTVKEADETACMTVSAPYIVISSPEDRQ